MPFSRETKRRLAVVRHVEHPPAPATHPADLDRFLRMLPVATWLGAIELDHSPAGRTTRRAQLRVLKAVLADPRTRSQPMATAHSRGAEQDTIS